MVQTIKTGRVGRSGNRKNGQKGCGNRAGERSSRRFYWKAAPCKSGFFLATLALLAACDPGPERKNGPCETATPRITACCRGIRGTSEPASIGISQSQGCARLPNWDAARRAQECNDPGIRSLPLCPIRRL